MEYGIFSLIFVMTIYITVENYINYKYGDKDD